MRAEVLEAEGSCHLLVTHKSILRAHLCVALGLPPTSFRAFDINNGGICTFR
jgi:broad specificity phosphatase PhoE